MRICFGWFPMLFFNFGDQTCVYELDGEIVGGIVLRKFRIDAQRTGGTVMWLFTHPDARGMGIAGAMLDTALEWFAQQGCSDIFAGVEGYNTPSGNRFAAHGFTPLRFTTQLKRYGRYLPRVWLGSFHLIDVGFFLWARQMQVETAHDAESMPPFPEEQNPRSDTAHSVHAGRGLGGAALVWGLLGTFIIHTLSAYFLYLRSGVPLDFSLLWQVPSIIALLLVVRTGIMISAGRAAGLDLEYRPWESGMSLTFLVSAVFGGLFIAPGSLYPRRRVWSYADFLPRLGPMAFAGAFSILALGWGFRILENMELSTVLAGLAATGSLYFRIFLVFEVLLPVFPFTGFNGRRILDWRRQSWAILAMGVVLLWVAALFL